VKAPGFLAVLHDQCEQQHRDHAGDDESAHSLALGLALPPDSLRLRLLRAAHT
jgi:hypothetical protein